MGSLNIVNNAKFNPFSFDDFLKPIMMADQEHKSLEEAMATLDTNAATLEQALNEQTDSRAHGLYKSYRGDLENHVEQLASSGLNVNTRRGLLGLKRRYASDISPIQEAVKRRIELGEAQRQALEKDGSLLFDTPASAISIDTLMANPAESYRTYSGNMLTQQAQQAASNLSKKMYDNPRYWRRILGNQYFEAMERTGFDPKVVMQVIQGNEEASRELSRIKQDILSSSGIAEWGNEEALRRAEESINTGLWGAVGQDKLTNLANRGYMAPQAEAAPEPVSKQNFIRGFGHTERGKGEFNKFQKELDFIQKYKDDPSKLDDEVQAGDGIHTLGTSIIGDADLQTPALNTATKQTNYGKRTLKKLQDRYGTKDWKELEENIIKDMSNTAKRHAIFVPDVEDYSPIATYLKQSVKPHYTESGQTGLKEIVDGKPKDYADIDTVSDILENPSSLSVHFTADNGLVVTGRAKGGKSPTKSFQITSEFIDPTAVRTVGERGNIIVNTKYNMDLEEIRRKRDSGDIEGATMGVNEIFSNFITKAYNMHQKDFVRKAK